MARPYKIAKVNISINLVNNDYKTTNNICELCKTPLYGKGCIVGKCHHAFHKECVRGLHGANNTLISCPIDNSAWHLAYTTFA